MGYPAGPGRAMGNPAGRNSVMGSPVRHDHPTTRVVCNRSYAGELQRPVHSGGRLFRKASTPSFLSSLEKQRQNRSRS